ncbi:hypothetical protein [Vibrio scophthalmi]|uniref:Uncharacterized protein n=1 Tax=Vibrio scophthalmi LMG 19158 TaxID=870967 RepID=F9RS28_9VIBR|nr:hypothetical protein [Vibrio scophthalmi]EGU32532.1 hypothetical protein VIS19158_12822 [Vibrio scophthalmi LMG 19158]
MNYLKKSMLFIPLVILAGCNTSSSKTNSVQKIVAKPLTNYVYSDKKADKLMEERKQIIESIKVTYKGKAYHNVKFAEAIDSEQVVVKLVDVNDHEIDLLFDIEGNKQCHIYEQPNIESFPCSDVYRSENSTTTLIDAKTIDSHIEVKVEYNNELSELISSIGSTVLTASQNGNHIDIITSFAFDDFYQDVLKTKAADNHSTLGATTYLQLEEIIEQYRGSDMTLKFNNRIGGSADDDINLYSAVMIHKNNLITMVTPTGSVFSGGTDLFAAGKERILQKTNKNVAIEANKQIGVHSWSDGKQSAKEIPYTDESHRKQATFCQMVLGDKGVDFYLFTLNAAPFNGAHWITKSDSDKYNFITRIE